MTVTANQSEYMTRLLSKMKVSHHEGSASRQDLWTTTMIAGTASESRTNLARDQTRKWPGKPTSNVSVDAGAILTTRLSLVGVQTRTCRAIVIAADEVAWKKSNLESDQTKVLRKTMILSAGELLRTSSETGETAGAMTPMTEPVSGTRLYLVLASRLPQSG